MKLVSKSLGDSIKNALVVSFGPTNRQENGYYKHVHSLKEILNESLEVESIEFTDYECNKQTKVGSLYIGTKNNVLYKGLKISIYALVLANKIKSADVIFIEGSFFIPFAIISYIFGKKIVFESHGFISVIAIRYKGSVIDRLVRRIFGFGIDKITSILSDLTLVTSEADKAFAIDFLKINKKKVMIRSVIIEHGSGSINGVFTKDLRAKFGVTKDQLMAIFVGDLLSIQNKTAVEFIIANETSIPNNVRLIIVGRGFQNFAYYSDKILFTGFVDNIEDIYEAADLLLAPLTTGTGIKTKIIEAFAHGLTVVTTLVGIEGIDYGHCNGVFVFEKENFFLNFKKIAKFNLKGIKHQCLRDIYLEKYSIKVLRKEVENILVKLSRGSDLK